MSNEIAKFHATISADVKDFKKGLDETKSGMNSLEKSSGLVGNAAKLAMGVGVAAVAGLGVAIGKTIGVAADFEQGIADMGAMMALSSEETAKLQDYIMDLALSPDLKVSATEATEAITALGTAGLTSSEIMNGAAEATVLLANATGGDFGMAANLATDVMSQFNIEASDMVDTVDQMAGVTIATKMTIDDYRMAVAQAGGVAGAVGVDFDDFNAILGVTASNFDKGSDAGTSLKTFLTTLIPKSNEAADVMAALGIETIDYARMAEYLSGVIGEEVIPSHQGVYEAFQKTKAGADAAAVSDDKLAKAFNALKNQYGENQFFDDTTGMMKSGAEIAEVLQNAFGDLTEQQKNEAAATIFGNDAMRTAFGLMEAGAEGVKAMDAEIKKADATELAAKRMDTFQGAMEIMMGVMESLSISIGQKFLPVLRPLVEQFANLASTYGPKVVDFFGDMATKMTEALNVGIDWATRVIPPLWQGFVNITSAIQKMIKPITDLVGDWVKWQDVLLVVGAFLIGPLLGMVGAATVALVQLAVPILALVAAVAAMRNAWETNFLGIRDAAIEFFGGFTEFVKKYSGIWKGDWGKTLSYFKNNTAEAFGIMWRNVENIWSRGKQEVMHVINTWLSETSIDIDTFVRANKSRFHVWWGNIRKDFKEGVDWVVFKLQEWYDWFNALEWVKRGKEIIQGLWDGAKQIWFNFKSWWDGLWRTLTGTVDVKMKIGSPSKEMEKRGAWAIEGFALGAKGAMPLAMDAMSGLAYGAMGSASSPAGVSTSRIEELLTILIAELRAKNMTANVSVSGSGGGLSSQVAFASVRP